LGNFYRRDMELKRVKVTWLDAWGDDAHLEEEAAVNLIPIERQNIGLLIKGDSDKVILTSGLIYNLFAGKTFIDGIMVIPRGMIKEIKVYDD
jgi:hypothetical protein